MAIESLYQRAYAYEAQVIGASHFPPLQRNIRDIQTTRTQFFGLFDNEKLVAIAEVDVNAEVLFIEGFAVEPQNLRLGNGSRLLRFILASAGTSRARVSTAVSNLPAIALYRKFGFTEREYPQTNERIELVTLECALSD
jgi:ribosomal protein S18 acetylase RimI-like enzyme